MERSVLTLLLKKAGLSEEEDYKKLLVGDAADVPVSDALGGAILAKLLTVDDAVNNTEVQRKLKPTILKDVDEKTLSILKDAGLSEEDAKKVVEGKSTPEKLTEVIKKLGELDKVKNKTGESEREREWTTTRTKLETDLKAAQDATAAEIKARNDLKFTYDFRDYMGNKDASGMQLLKSLPLETQLRLIRDDLNATATGKGLTIGFDGENKLRYFDKEGKVYHAAGVADPFDPRTDLEGVAKKLGFVDTAPVTTDPPRPVELPPGSPQPDQIGQRSRSTNLDIINQLNQPPTPAPAGS